MGGMRAAFQTLGCRTNHYETDAMRSQFLQAGFIEVPFDEVADVYLLNTCAVTGEADRKSRQLLRRARRQNPGAIIVAVGCHVELNQEEGLADICVGSSGKREAVRLVLAKLGRPGGQAHMPGESETRWAYEEFGLVGQPSETRAYIKIEDGCDDACSYCTVPLARGPVRSRERGKILEEAAALASRGFKEIILTGVHVCSYGADLGFPSHTVTELALELAAISGIERIRLGSLEPQSITPEFIRLARENRKLLPHFHLSLQSGSDSVLRRMNRHYDSSDYRQVVAMLRQAYSGGLLRSPGLSTDIMAGFPGETEAEHEASLAFCREIGFSRMHIFRYSSRPKTAAAAMPGQVDPRTINRRADTMLELAGQLAQDFHSRQVGRLQEVLLEEKQADGLFAGYTPEYAPARIPASPLAAGYETGQIVKVKAIAATRNFLICDNANTFESCYDGSIRTG
jgi:threonylcarbamoyladenosine tRNA methylthiotransferase MtaB